MALRRLVTSAATIAILGCSDGATDGASVPPFGGPLPNTAVNPPPADNAGEEGQVPGGANPEASPGGAGEVPAAEQGPSEGQNPDDFGIANPEGSGAEPGGGGGSTDMVAGADQAGGEQQPGTEQPPPAEPPPSEPPPEETVEEPEPVPEEPEPIVRPPLDCGAPPPVLQGGIQGCAVNDGGTVGGQSWFLWYNGGGNGCMTTFDTPSGAFSAEWNSPGDFLARLGPWFDETQTHQEVGEIGADMKFTRQGNGGGFSYVGIYGWTLDPLVEFYIVEDAFGGPPRTFGPTQPPPGGNATFSVDGGQYEIRTNQRNNQPAITGENANFLQVFSVRQGARSCGHVSISEHFRQWESRGVTLGRMKEAKIVVEVGNVNGTGSITFSHANVTVTPPDN